MSDKNLGPIVTERDKYVRMVLHDHLLDQNTYRRLGPGELEFRDAVIRNNLRWKIITAFKKQTIKKNKLTYFQRAIRMCTRTPQFYATIKLHKTKLSSRPVTGTGGSLLAALSKWVDFKLQPLTKFCPAYIRDWEDLTVKLKKTWATP